MTEAARGGQIFPLANARADRSALSEEVSAVAGAPSKARVQSVCRRGTASISTIAAARTCSGLGKPTQRREAWAFQVILASEALLRPNSIAQPDPPRQASLARPAPVAYPAPAGPSRPAASVRLALR